MPFCKNLLWMRAIHIAAAQASRGLGIHHGPIHAEASLNEQGVYIIEVAARTAGGRARTR